MGTWGFIAAVSRGLRAGGVWILDMAFVCAAELILYATLGVLIYYGLWVACAWTLNSVGLW